MSDDLAFASALDQARLIRKREVSPIDLVELYLARIERLNPALNAFVTVTADLARQGALQAAKQSRDDLPPFHGVPISYKDLQATAGVRTTRGSRVFANHVPTEDARCVALLRAAGFIILGKTNTPEFGAGPFTEPTAFGICRNPWDLSRTPSGSSGGAAAALAAGLCPVAQASDGGGSIRNPAAACGLVGLKPSRGRISNAPAINDLLSSSGVLTRTVADTAALLDILSEPVFGDPWPVLAPGRPFIDEVGLPPGKLRIYFTTEPPYEQVIVHPEIRSAVENTAHWLEALGHDLFEQAPDWPGAELNEVLADLAVAHYAMSDFPINDVEPINRLAIERGRAMSLADYMATTESFQRQARRVASIFHDCDVALMPTTAVQPPPAGAFQAAMSADDPRAAFAELVSYFPPPFTRAWNVTGQPAISLPLHVDNQGFPIGIQLVGRPGAEATLIRVAAQLEAAHPWRQRRPSFEGLE